MIRICRNKRHRNTRKLVVIQRNHHHSVFGGGHYQTSNSSEVRCLECGRFWRTKAQYVDGLRDATEEEAHRHV